MKIRPEVTDFLICGQDGQADRRTHTHDEPIIAFRNFANTPKKGIYVDKIDW
jgi:hypothetical protein